MQQSNFKKKTSLFILLGIASLQHVVAQQPIVGQSAPFVPVGAPMQPNNAQVIAAPIVYQNTLKKVEIAQREKIERELKIKNAQEIILENQISGAPPIGLPPPVVAPVPIKKVINNSLDDYFTVSIVLYRGEASADVNYPNGEMTLKVGDIIKGWVVSRITMDGVQIQKTLPVNKKTKQQKILTKTLKPFIPSQSIDVNGMPTSVSGIIPVQALKSGSNQDSTTVQMAGGLPQLPSVNPSVK